MNNELRNYPITIRERDGIAVVEDQGQFFCVGVYRSPRPFQQNTLINTLERARKRNPFMGGGTTLCSFTAHSLRVCATPRTRRAAMAAFRRYRHATKTGGANDR